MCPDYRVGDVHFEWEPLAPGVHRCRLPFLDVTVGVVAGSTGVLLIDCGTTPAEAHAVAADVHILTGREVTDIVITHHHFDHVLGSAGFPEARLLAAAPVAEAVATGRALLRDQAIECGADPVEVDLAVTGLRTPRTPECPFRIGLGGRVVTVDQPGRGHTDHDLVVVIAGPPPVVFCGDLVEESADPAVADDSDLAAWPATLDRVLALGGPRARYVPGHGAVVDAAFIRRQQDWLRSRW